MSNPRVAVFLSIFNAGNSHINDSSPSRSTLSEYRLAFGKDPDSEIFVHGCDDGLWQIKDKNGRLLVYRRSNKKQDWEIFSELREEYQLVNGQVIPHMKLRNE